MARLVHVQLDSVRVQRLEVGAVAVWTNSYYGHVAVVTAVNGSQIQVVESNYAGNMYVSNYAVGSIPVS